MYRPCKIAAFASVKGYQNNFHRIIENAELGLSRASSPTPALAQGTPTIPHCA